LPCFLRTEEEFDKICDLLEEETTLTSYNSTTYGINNSSPLNKLKYFHVCNFELPPDVMHNLLEGYVPYTMKLLLNQLINIEHITAFKQSDSSLQLWRKNKPNCLTSRELLSEDHGLNQSGKLR